MDTLYYRKTAEIVARDEQDPMLRRIAERVLGTPHKGKARVANADKRAMKAWMRAWCDRADARLTEIEATRR